MGGRDHLVMPGDIIPLQGGDIISFRWAASTGISTRRGMDARTDLRLVEIRERTAAAGHRLRDNLRLHLSDRTEGRGLVALSDASP